jgi:hypothetical protein
MTQALARRGKPWDIREEYIFRYFQMYLRANANPEPDLTGAFYLGDLDEVREKNWQKATPYSPAQLRTARTTSEEPGALGKKYREA